MLLLKSQLKKVLKVKQRILLLYNFKIITKDDHLVKSISTSSQVLYFVRISPVFIRDSSRMFSKSLIRFFIIMMFVISGKPSNFWIPFYSIIFGNLNWPLIIFL